MTMALWSRYEVCWETEFAYLNQYFRTRPEMLAYAARLAGLPTTLRVETFEHAGPHGGPVAHRVLKGAEEVT